MPTRITTTRNGRVISQEVIPDKPKPKVTPTVTPTPAPAATIEPPKPKRTIHEAKAAAITSGAAREHRKLTETEAQRIADLTGARPPMSMVQREAYSADSPHSWFRDRIIHENRNGEHFPLKGDAQARERLGSVQSRAISTIAFELLGHETPAFIAQAFTTAVRAFSYVSGLYQPAGTVLANSLDGGLSVSTPRINTGATTAVQTTGGAAISNTDSVTANSQSLVTTIAGRSLVATPLFELAGGQADIWIARDLGASYASVLDNEIITGTSASGRTLGLLNVPSATAATFTAASPNAGTLYSALLDLYRATFVARGLPPTHLVLAPKTLARLMDVTNAAAPPVPLVVTNEEDGTLRMAFGPQVIPSANVPINLGAGTNEARAIYATESDLVIYAEPPRFLIADQPHVTTNQLDIVVYGMTGTGYRRPEGVSILSGTGLI